jgi:hypothetical protein
MRWVRFVFTYRLRKKPLVGDLSKLLFQSESGLAIVPHLFLSRKTVIGGDAMAGGRWRTRVGGVALMFLMGCAGQQFAGLGIFQSADGEGSAYLVAGSPESTAVALQASLKRLGVSAVATPQGQDIRIASNTPKGDKFALVLTRVQGQQGDSTRVKFEWENGPDEQTRTHVEASLKAHAGTPTNVAQK